MLKDFSELSVSIIGSVLFSGVSSALVNISRPILVSHASANISVKSNNFPLLECFGDLREKYLINSSSREIHRHISISDGHMGAKECDCLQCWLEQKRLFENNRY